MNKNKYFFILIILLIIFLILSGCEEIEDNNIEKETVAEPDLVLLAFQLESQVRTSFKSAYNSWINMDRMTENKEENIEQILTVFRTNLIEIVVEDEIKKYTDKLRNIAIGGEGEITFPVHEVVREVNIQDKNDNDFEVEFITTRFYPATEWEGDSYSKDYQYTVFLLKGNEGWMIKRVDYK